MSSNNLFSRLRALLPPAPVLIGLVVEIHADDTTTVELPLGVGLSEYGPGVAAGSLLRVRGSSVPVGANAFVRDGVIESRAPDGDVLDITVGTVREVPLGPPGLRLEGSVGNPTGNVGVAFALDLRPFFVDGYVPLVFSLAAGTLPAGLAIDASLGVTGTPTLAEVRAGIVIRCEDSTRRQVLSNAFTITVSP